MSDRASLLSPFITPSVRELILKRLTEHAPLIKKGAHVPTKRKSQIKIALLALQIINPFEELFAPEEALIRGIDERTLTLRRSAGDLRAPKQI